MPRCSLVTAGAAGTDTAFVDLQVPAFTVASAAVPAQIGEPVVVRSPADTLPMLELIEVVAAAMAVAPPPVKQAPVWLCPIGSPVRFGDTYGEGRSGGWRHLGVDMTAPSGTPTVAPVGGTVRYSRDSAGGLSWHLDGDDGMYYYGTHLSKFGSVTESMTRGVFRSRMSIRTP